MIRYPLYRQESLFLDASNLVYPGEIPENHIELHGPSIRPTLKSISWAPTFQSTRHSTPVADGHGPSKSTGEIFIRKYLLHNSGNLLRISELIISMNMSESGK